MILNIANKTFGNNVMHLGLNRDHTLEQGLAILDVGLVFYGLNNWSKLHGHNHDNGVILM